MIDNKFLEKFLTTQNEILTKLSIIETKIDDYKEVKDKCDTAFHTSEQNKKDIEILNNKITWVIRSILGALISGVIAFIFTLLK
jgi:hypothetical protein